MRWLILGPHTHGKTSELLKQYKKHGGQLLDPKSLPQNDAPGRQIARPYARVTDNRNARTTFSISSEPSPWRDDTEEKVRYFYYFFEKHQA